MRIGCAGCGFPGRSLFAEDLDEDAFASLTIKFGIEDLLPGAEVQVAPRDGDQDLVMNQNVPHVRVAVVFAREVVFVGVIAGCEALQHLQEVLLEAFLVIVDEDGGGDMHGGDQNKAFLNSGLLHDFADGVRDAEDLDAFWRFKPEVFGVCPHRWYFRGGVKEALRTENLGKRFGGRWVLRGISVQVEPGELVFLVGRNGSGKTTLLRVLATLLRASEGRFWVFGRSATEEPIWVRRKLSCVFHGAGFYEELTVQENMAFWAAFWEGDLRKGRAILERFGEEEIWEMPVRALSRGQRQKLALARALMREAPLLLWDEPFTGLDRESVLRLKETLLEERRRGVTIVLSTHILYEGFAEPDRWIWLVGGRARMERPEEVPVAKL